MSTLELVRGKRLMAERARRLALGLSAEVDRQNLLEYAAELEAQASELERLLRNQTSGKS